MSGQVDAELAEAVECVRRIFAQRFNRDGDPTSWETLLVMLRAYAANAEARQMARKNMLWRQRAWLRRQLAGSWTPGGGARCQRFP